VLVRSDQEAVIVNLDIQAAKQVKKIRWVDPIHRVNETAAMRL